MKQSIRLLWSSLCLVMALFSSQLLAQETEPNNTITTANPLMTDVSLSGDLSLTDTDDYFEIALPDDGDLTVGLSAGAGLSARVVLYNSSGAFISQTTTVAGPSSIDLVAQCLGQDTYFARVQRLGGAGGYSLGAVLDTPQFPTDAEPNSTFALATEYFSDSETIQGRLGYSSPGVLDVVDYYGLLLPDDGNITVSGVFDESMTGRIAFYYKNGTFLNQSTNGSGDVSLSYSCLARDTVYLAVFRGSGCGAYSLTFDTDSPPVHDQDVEPNNSVINANSFIEDGGTVEGRMGYNGLNISDGVDYYGLVLPDDGNITVSGLFDETMTARIGFYYKNGSFLTQSTNVTGDVSLSYSCLARDTVYLGVFNSTGCGSYSLTFDTDTPPVHEQDVEPNNTILTANSYIEDGGTVEGRMGYNGLNISDGIDYYGLVLPDDGNITVSGSFDETMTGRIGFFYKNGTFLSQTVNTTGDVTLSYSCLARDTVYLGVFIGSGCGSYSLTFDTDTPPVHEQDVEPNNTVLTANSYIEDGGTVEGRMGYNGLNISDGIDYYGLVLPDDGNITVSGSFDETMTGRIALFYKNGTFLSQSQNTTGAVTLSQACLARDTVYLGVFIATGCGSYSLTYEHDYPTYGQDSEPNNAVGSATVIDNAPSYEGHLRYSGLGISDTQDFYRLTVTQAPFELDAKVDLADGLTGRLILYTSAGGFIAQTIDQTGEFSLQHTITTAGDYVISVLGASSCGSYRLGDLCGEYPTVMATPEGPLNKCPDAPVELAASAGLDAYIWSSDGADVGVGQTYSATSAGQYQVVGFDINGCADTSNVVIIADIDCDDNDPCTDDSCDPLTGCTNTFSGDDDNDGTCNNLDLCPNDPNKIAPGDCGCGNAEQGESCDDGDAMTVNDEIDDNCECSGQLTGCTDMDACNYDPLALVDDNSCISATGCDECDSQGGVIDNPEIGTPCDDGDPTTEGDVFTDCGVCGGIAIPGCTDEDACNYDVTATIDDNSCISATGCDECDGQGGVIDNPEIGTPCDDGDPTTEGDVFSDCGVCGGIAIPGCTDEDACNYDVTATIDDNSCILATGCDECDGQGGVIDNPEVGENCDDLDQTTINDVVGEDCQCLGDLIVEGCTDPAASNYNPNANVDDDSCIPVGDSPCSFAENVDVNEFGSGSDFQVLDIGDGLGDTDCDDNFEQVIYRSFVAQSANDLIYAGVQGVNFNGGSGFDAIVSVYSACDEEPIGCYDNYPADALERVLVGGFIPGETYYYSVAHKGDDALLSSPLFYTGVHTFADMTLNSNSCGADGLQLNDVIMTERDDLNEVYSLPAVPVNGHRYRFSQDGEELAVVNRPTVDGFYLQLSQVDGLSYGETYQVEVAHSVPFNANGMLTTTWSGYGSPCEITLDGGIPLTQLKASLCSVEQEFVLSDQLFADLVDGAEAYRFTFDDGVTSYSRVSSNYAVRLFQVPGLSYATSYTVTVASRVAGQWSDEGSACVITMASTPQNTALSPSACGETFDYPSSQQLLAIIVPGADEYQYRFDDMAGSVTDISSSDYSLLLGNALGLPAGQYLVGVRVRTGSVWGDFSDRCVIGLGAHGLETKSVTGSVTDGLAFSVYPNPSDGQEVRVMVQDQSSPARLDLSIRDITGKLMLRRSIAMTSGGVVLDLDGLVESGVYIITLDNGSTLQSQRLVIH